MDISIAVAGKNFIENVKTLNQAKEHLKRKKIDWNNLRKNNFEQIFCDQMKVPVAKFYKSSGTLVYFDKIPQILP